MSFDMIGALEPVKETLREVVMLPLQRPELFRKGQLLKVKGLAVRRWTLNCPFLCTRKQWAGYEREREQKGKSGGTEWNKSNHVWILLQGFYSSLNSDTVVL